MYKPYIQVEPSIAADRVWKSGIYKIARPLGLFQHDRLDRSTSDTDINDWYKQHPNAERPLTCALPPAGPGEAAGRAVAAAAGANAMERGDETAEAEDPSY